MKRIVIGFLLWASLSPLSSPSFAEIYKLNDRDGNVFFSSAPKIEITKAKRPYDNINVIMYMTAWCGYCRKAREYLQSLNVNLVEYNVEKDANRRAEMLRKSGGSTGVPLIDVEGIIIRGYNQRAINDAVEKRR